MEGMGCGVGRERERERGGVGGRKRERERCICVAIGLQTVLLAIERLHVVFASEGRNAGDRSCCWA